MRQRFGPSCLSIVRRRALNCLREIFLERSCSAYRLSCQFPFMRWGMLGDDAAPIPSGAILSGRPRRLHATPRASAGRILASRAVCQWLPHRIVDDKASCGSDSKELPHLPCHFNNTAGQLLHRLGWTTPEARRTCFGAERKAIERWKRKDWPRVKKTPRGWAPTCLCGRIGLLVGSPGG